MQQALIDLGLSLPRSTKNGTAPPDGVFGTETLQRIKGLQFRQGIQRDGIIGRETLGELDSLLTGNHVPGTPATTRATTITTTDVPEAGHPAGQLPAGKLKVSLLDGKRLERATAFC